MAPEPLVGQLDLDFRQLERVLASLVASLNFISHCKSIPGQLGSLNYPSPGEEAAAPDGKNFHPDKFASIGVIRG